LFQIENREDTTIVHVLGNIDFSAKAAFRETLELVERHANGAVIVDLDHCPYVDSEGLGELIRAHRTWGTRLSIVVPAYGVVARVFSVSGLDVILNVKSSVTDALLQVIG
jgi:anti-anti-sigma factor